MVLVTQLKYTKDDDNDKHDDVILIGLFYH